MEHPMTEEEEKSPGSRCCHRPEVEQYLTAHGAGCAGGARRIIPYSPRRYSFPCQGPGVVWRRSAAI